MWVPLDSKGVRRMYTVLVLGFRIGLINMWFRAYGYCAWEYPWTLRVIALGNTLGPLKGIARMCGIIKGSWGSLSRTLRGDSAELCVG